MTTLAKISEQLQLIMDDRNRFGRGMHIEEIKLLVSQAINNLFKTEKVAEIRGMEDYNVSGTMIATYEDIPVEQYKDRSKATLPVYPIQLPMGMGVWYVSPDNDIDNFFVPLLPGQSGLTKSVKLLNKFENRVAYEVNGRNILFTTNILEKDIDTIMVREVVNDVGSLGEYDPLPIPADMEQDVIQSVIKIMEINNQVDIRQEKRV